MFLALTIGATMDGATFLQPRTLFILILGAVAFMFSTAGGVLFAKVMNLFLPARLKVNPCIGAAGVSAVPMSARVVQTFVSTARWCCVTELSRSGIPQGSAPQSALAH